MSRIRIIQFCQQIRTFTKSLSEHPLGAWYEMFWFLRVLPLGIIAMIHGADSSCAPPSYTSSLN